MIDHERIAERIYKAYVGSDDKTDFMDKIRIIKPLEGWDEKMFFSLCNKLWHGGYHQGLEEE